MDFSKTLLGVWIVINFLYILTWIVQGIVYLIRRRFERISDLIFFDLFMIVFWSTALIIGAGVVVSKYL